MTSEAVATEAVTVSASAPVGSLIALSALVIASDGSIRSKKEALEIAKAHGFGRSAVEAEIRRQWAAHSTAVAEVASLEMGRAARAGHKLTRHVNKSGGVTVRISAKPMAQAKVSAKDTEIAALRAELAALKATVTTQA